MNRLCIACETRPRRSPRSLYCGDACRWNAKRRRDLGLPVNTRASGKRYSLRRLAS